jgi:hypothetical protein
MNMINIADIKNPTTGKTFREENSEKNHNIPLGTLVEVGEEISRYSGLRLFVVDHNRDCDGTPLYTLSFEREWHEGYVGDYTIVAQAMTINGFSEGCLKIIR